MKTFHLTMLLAFSTCLVFDFTANAQVTARRITRRAVEANAAENKRIDPNPAPAPVPAPKPQPAVVPPQILTNAVPEKTKEQKDEILRKTIEFQKKRAEAGAPTAQYDLGLRYLNGDGVEKDLELARKWFQAAATNGNSQAVKKLEQLNKLSDPAKPSPN